MALSLVLHGHFYQPPREDPFLDEVETEESAKPFHDWNQRIERECYRAVVAARLTAPSGRIRRIVNTLEWMSFNFGPTLLEWMEREAPDTYRAILAADRASVARLNGHGNAIAQPYHHTILPLASRRDKRTEVRWGIADFRRRFGREPAGMWLPETAVDDETLDVLSAEGIQFTIIAPAQVQRAPAQGRPGVYRTASGRSIALCVYHGGLSHGIAFGGLLHDARAWVASMITLGTELAGQRPPATLRTSTPVPVADTVRTTSGKGRALDASLRRLDPLTLDRLGAEDPVVLSAATDGETYGHHHRFGEMALARAIEDMRGLGATVENFAAFLARSPAVDEVELVAPSSWSCAHGVERWRSNCGCRIDGARNPSQEWRAPLRLGLESLARDLHAIFEREAAALVSDPWSVRDEYGTVVATGSDELARFARRALAGVQDETRLVRLRELLEMERDALRMFTSCAWFFDDIAGLEPRQVLRYAARAITLSGLNAQALEARLLEELSGARSNQAAHDTGRHLYLAHAKPRLPAAVRLAAAAVMARQMGVDARQRIATAEIHIGAELIVVIERRTGRRHKFAARAAGTGAADLAAEVVEATGERHRLTLIDLPERPRLAIRAVLRRRLLPRCLTPEELERLVAGESTLQGLIRVALLRNIARLVDGGPRSLQITSELLDLVEQMEGRIPFDAQTTFWRVRDGAPASARPELDRLGARLGFALEERPGGGEPRD